jgi:hypothetical protein
VSGDHGRLDPAGEVVARAGVVARAAGRASIGEDDIGMVLIDACAALVRGLGVEPEAWRELGGGDRLVTLLATGLTWRAL